MGLLLKCLELMGALSCPGLNSNALTLLGQGMTIVSPEQSHPSTPDIWHTICLISIRHNGPGQGMTIQGDS